MGEDVRREAQRLIEKDERTDGRNQDRGPTRHRHTHAHTPRRERGPQTNKVKGSRALDFLAYLPEPKRSRQRVTLT